MNLRLTPCRTDRSPIVADRANASMARSLRSLSANSAAAPTHRSILYHRGKIQGAVIRPGAVNPAQRVTRLWTTPLAGQYAAAGHTRATTLAQGRHLCRHDLSLQSRCQLLGLFE